MLMALMLLLIMMIMKNSTLARTFSQQTIDQENQKQIISDKVFKAATKDCGKRL